MIFWLTTAPPPRRPDQHGHFRHAVNAPDGRTTLELVRDLRAVCSLLPRHGWEEPSEQIRQDCPKCWAKLKELTTNRRRL